MALEIVRRIRGNINGSIEISALEDHVIAHPYFQRLRRVHQTSFLSYTFPGATHTRFEHSLGVLHLAKIAWSKLKSNQERIFRSTKKHHNFAEKEKSNGYRGHGVLNPTFDITQEIFKSDYVFQALRLAALLHDIGHPSFSHSGERLLPSYEEILKSNNNLPDYIKDYLNKKIEKAKSRNIPSDKLIASHETYTLLLIDKMLRQIYSEHEFEVKVDPQDVLAIIDTDISTTENSPIKKLNVHQLCHELISGEFDIDRMDYLRRDSKEAGVIYGIFDADRILDSLALYSDQNGVFHLAIQYSGLAAFEDYLRARQSMYLQLYFHKTSVAAEANLQNLIGMFKKLKLPAALDEYVEVDDYTIYHYLQTKSNTLEVDDQKKEKVRNAIKNLLQHRILWKRVYELSGNSNAVRHRPEMEKAKAALKEVNIPFEQMSSKSNLTNFRPRSDSGKSSNYLRLIKKDAGQFPRVVPIEDHTDLISEKNSVHISRIYVANEITDGGSSTYQMALEAIGRTFD